MHRYICTYSRWFQWQPGLFKLEWTQVEDIQKLAIVLILTKGEYTRVPVHCGTDRFSAGLDISAMLAATNPHFIVGAQKNTLLRIGTADRIAWIKWD